MRKLAIAGFLLASCTLAAAQENMTDTTTQSTGTGFSRRITPAPKKMEAPSAISSAASRRAREEATLNRRNEVILKLREIAVRTGDDALLKAADELQDRAWDLYQQKTAALGDNVLPSAAPLQRTGAAETGQFSRAGGENVQEVQR